MGAEDTVELVRRIGKLEDHAQVTNLELHDLKIALAGNPTTGQPGLFQVIKESRDFLDGRISYMRDVDAQHEKSLNDLKLEQVKEKWFQRGAVAAISAGLTFLLEWVKSVK